LHFKIIEDDAPKFFRIDLEEEGSTGPRKQKESSRLLDEENCSAIHSKTGALSTPEIIYKTLIRGIIRRIIDM